MRTGFIILVLLFILGIAMAGDHILVERLFILSALVLFFCAVFALLGLWRVKGSLNYSSPYFQASKPVPVEIVAENRSLLPKPFLKLWVNTSLPGKNESLLVNLPVKGSFSWNSEMVFPHRGYYKLGPFFAEASDPFGLFRFRRQLDREKEIMVYPSTVDLPGFWAEAAAESDIFHRRLLSGESSGEISGVREYVPGDSLSRVHWRSTAHTGKLIVKEFEPDLSERVWIFLDLCQESCLGTGLETTVEYGITIAASLIEKYSDAGRHVGLIAQDNDYHFYSARQGVQNKWRLMEALAVFQASGRVTLDRLINRALGQIPGSSVAVIITPSAGDELVDAVTRLKKQAVQAVVILLDAASFGGRSSMESAETRLSHLHIPFYTIRQGDDLAGALNNQGMKLAAASGSQTN